MNDRLGCHDMEMLCRQRAKVDPKHDWKWLGEADRWRELEHREIAWRFQQKIFSSRCMQAQWLLGQTLSTAILGPSSKRSP